MDKWSLGIASVMLIGIITAFYMLHTNLVELEIAKREQTTLIQTIKQDSEEITDLLDELRWTAQVMAEREQQLQELQASVYSQFKNIEEIGQKDPVAGDLLHSTIPDSLWNEINGQCNTDKGCEADGTGGPAKAIPGTTDEKQNGASPD